MAIIRRIVNNQIEISATSSLNKSEALVQIGNLDNQLIELNQQISDLQGQIFKITTIRDELQSLTNQITDVIIPG
jgi:regulator of replication initiation timing